MHVMSDRPANSQKPSLTLSFYPFILAFPYCVIKKKCGCSVIDLEPRFKCGHACLLIYDTESYLLFTFVEKVMSRNGRQNTTRGEHIHTSNFTIRVLRPSGIVYRLTPMYVASYFL